MSAFGAAALALSIGSAAHAQFGALPTINAGARGAIAPGFALPRINAAVGSGFLYGPAGYVGSFTVPLVGAALATEIVPTDPLIRQIQVGPTPVGLLGDVDPASGVGVAGIPGAGGRVVRAVGPVVSTPAGPAVRAVDAATGVQFLAMVPGETTAPAVITNPGALMAARVVRVGRDSVILEREEDGRRMTEIVPPNQVYTPVQGGFVPAGTRVRLRPGAEVFISADGVGRGTIIVTRPAAFGTRANSASQPGNGR